MENKIGGKTMEEITMDDMIEREYPMDETARIEYGIENENT